MAQLSLPAPWLAVRDLAPVRAAQFRLCCDTGKFGRALALLPPASRPNAAADIWESLASSQRPQFVADLVNGAGNVIPSYLFAGFIAQALRNLRDSGHPVTDCATSLRCLKALPPMVIAWRAAEAGDLPGRGLVWHMRVAEALKDAQELRREKCDAVVYVIRLPRTLVAGMLRGLRVLIEPRHTAQAEAVSGIEDCPT